MLCAPRINPALALMRTSVLVAATMLAAAITPTHAAPRWAIVVHGGAGVIERKDLSAEQEAAYRAAMARATKAGAAILETGGSAVDAVEAAIVLMEDDPLFNAGRGAVFTAAGRNELDASIMDGRSLAAGSVAGVTRTRHPISLARRVMEKSPHVMLISSGADEFSKQQGLEQVEPGWFYTERRWSALEKFLREKGLPIPPKPPGVPLEAPADGLAHDEGKKGTVGVVALDVRGNLAAGTSTGGTTGKRWGRVGDSPIIGAGNYASNASCAVSATGAGEYFIRLTVAREICALVELKGLGVQAAADEVVQKRLTALGGDGGVIALTPDGQAAWSFNSSGMYRARMADGQPLTVGIYKDEP
jgi:beta-aspartyl-peptidase (threonine type)